MARRPRGTAPTRRLVALAAAGITAATLTVTAITGTPAHAAATGQVVVFTHELARATTYTDPNGCNALPVAAHVLVNLTDRPIRIFADPACLSPSLTVQPGYGSHVSAVGSFSA